MVALPRLPERDLQGSIVMALNPAPGETGGWPQFVREVAAAWQRVSASQRQRTALFTSNYGEAGAIDLMGGALGLPRAYSGHSAYSGHNAFSLWGHPPRTDTYALAVGYNDARQAGRSVRDCVLLTTINNCIGLDNDEQGAGVMLCRVAGPWPALWPRQRHYD